MRKKLDLKQVWSFFLHRIIHTYGYKSHYLRLNIDIGKTDAFLKDFDLPVRRLSYEDFLLGDPVFFNESKLAVYRKRCADPDYQAFGIIENGKLVYSTWISLHRVGMTVETRPVYLLPNEGYLEDSYCSPLERGRGLHSRMNNYRIRRLYDAGKDRVIAIVKDGNIPAFKVQFKSGFEELGTFRQGYVFGIRYNTLKKEKFDGR